MYKSLNTGAIGIKADLVTALDYARRYGFDAVDFSISEAQTLSTERGIPATRELFTAAGVRPGPWGLPVNWRGEDEPFQQGLAQLPQVAELAKALDAARLITVVGPAQNERTKQEQYDYLLPRLRAVAAILADYNLRLGLEFIGPKTIRARFAHEFLYTANDVLAFARAAGPNVGLLHDCWHWYTSGGTMDELQALRSEDIVAVHINDAPAGIARDEQIDNVRLLPMESGVIDVPAYLRALQAISYDGPVIVEPFSARLREMTAEEALAETAAALDKAWKAAGL